MCALPASLLLLVCTTNKLAIACVHYHQACYYLCALHASLLLLVCTISKLAITSVHCQQACHKLGVSFCRLAACLSLTCSSQRVIQQACCKLVQACFYLAASVCYAGILQDGFSKGVVISCKLLSRSSQTKPISPLAAFRILLMILLPFYSHSTARFSPARFSPRTRIPLLYKELCTNGGSGTT